VIFLHFGFQNPLNIAKKIAFMLISLLKTVLEMFVHGEKRGINGIFAKNHAIYCIIV